MPNLEDATLPWEPERYLGSEEAQLAYLTAALEENNPAAFTEALGVVARARGMTQLAREVGTGRDTLYKALGDGGNPSFALIVKVLHALGATIDVKPAPKVVA